MRYSADQWLLFFYLYSFLGWVWESLYVSAKSGEWVNRGFVHGPFLPIYGSGAVVILFSTIAVRENLLLVYVLGAVSSTVLEYFTGAAMEKLFRVRYWDYTGHRFNLKGRVCLSVSLAWGVFAILLVRFIHPPFAQLILAVPQTAEDIAVLLLTAVVAADAAVSFNEAMDLKAMLIKLAESNAEMRRLQRRIDFAVALAADDIRRFREEKEVKKRKFAERIAENLQEARERRMARLDELAERAEEYFSRAEESAAACGEWRKRLEEQKRKLAERTDREYARSSRILHRNPGAVSKLYRQELEEIRNLLKK